MATATPELIAALERAAARIAKAPNYQWGHMGHCNCGHLAQELTPYTAAEIHAMALNRHGDWADQTLDYCPSSGLPFDSVIDTLLEQGLSLEDLRHLERLSDTAVRTAMGQAQPQKNTREDAVAYLRAWAKLLTDELIETVKIPVASSSPVLA